MKDFYIETPRLKLYPLHAGLAEEFHSIILDTFDTLHPWMSFAQHEPTLESLTENFREHFEAFTTDHQFHMGVYSKADGRFVGMVDCDDIHPPINEYKSVRPWDLGYWLHKNYVGKGYACEAVKALIDYVHIRKSVKVFSIHAKVENESSIKVAERLNFKLISIDQIPMRNKRTDWPEKVRCKIFILEY